MAKRAKKHPAPKHRVKKLVVRRAKPHHRPQSHEAAPESITQLEREIISILKESDKAKPPLPVKDTPQETTIVAPMVDTEAAAKAPPRELLETSPDKLYRMVKERKRVTIAEAAADFGLEERLIEEWGTILEDHRLVRVHYPPFGKPVLLLPLEKKIPGKARQKSPEQPAAPRLPPLRKRRSRKKPVAAVLTLAIAFLVLNTFVPAFSLAVQSLKNQLIAAVQSSPAVLAGLVVVVALVVVILILLVKRRHGPRKLHPPKAAPAKTARHARRLPGRRVAALLLLACAAGLVGWIVATGQTLTIPAGLFTGGVQGTYGAAAIISMIAVAVLVAARRRAGRTTRRRKR
ncbi:MAG: hypothetical protein HY369_04830 [Candidatus Aenigmarchaeota archaeon]|nr:hypothetical protein [Candidatus Aenigmarchaeota archaeon]